MKTRSTPASLSFKGQAPEHTTPKWLIGHERHKENILQKSVMEKLKSLGHYPTIYQQQKRVYLLNMKYDITWIWT